MDLSSLPHLVLALLAATVATGFGELARSQNP